MLLGDPKSHSTMEIRSFYYVSRDSEASIVANIKESDRQDELF